MKVMASEAGNLSPWELCGHGLEEVGGRGCEGWRGDGGLIYLSLHLIIVTLLHLRLPVDGNIRLGWGRGRWSWALLPRNPPTRLPTLAHS